MREEESRFDKDERRFCEAMAKHLDKWWHKVCHHFNDEDVDIDGDGVIDEADIGLDYREYTNYYRRLVYAFNEHSNEEGTEHDALDVEEAAYSLALDWCVTNLQLLLFSFSLQTMDLFFQENR